MTSLFRVGLLLLSVLSGALSLAHPQHSENGNFDVYEYNDYDSAPNHGPAPTFSPVPDLTQAQPPADPNVIFVPRLGEVRGKIAYRTLRNRPINAFLGLKYGTVGAGLGRFQKATVPVSTSNDVIDATQEPANCPQFPDLQKISAAEARGQNVDDCLTLNVYAPSEQGSYPVMVFVHGEMLFDGSAEEGQPDYFMEHDVVLVSINYRLAPFGFLSTLSDEMPGNVALADVQLALEWIQQYIRFFGGDPAKVTLFGQAGGATLVHALSLSGKAAGLFHKLILQSGTALNPYFLDEDPLMTIRTFARYARCPAAGRGVLSVSSCLERLSTSDVLKAFQKYWEDNESRGLRFTGGFKLVIGDKLGYLPQHPAALVAQNTYPTIAGVTKDSGAFIMSRFYKQLEQVRSRNITDYIDIVLKHTSQPRHHAIWKRLALDHIFSDAEIRNPTLQGLAQGLLELVNLILYRAPIIDSIRYTSKKYPTFLYIFDYRGQFHRFGHLDNPLPFEVDATLSDDNIYLFPYPEEVSHLNAEDRSTARALTTMWTDFAEYTDPTYNSRVWPNVSTEYGPFLRLTYSKERNVELDYHFGEGIPVPNLYPEYFTTTTTTTTTTPRPYPNSRYPNSGYQNSGNPASSYQNSGYPNAGYPNYPNNLNYQPSRPKPAFLAHETVLDGPEPQRWNHNRESYDPNSRN